MLIINEKYGIVMDPETLTVGESRPGFYKVSLAPIEEQISILETSVEDLLNCLDPTTGFALSQPNREGALSKAGFMTMFMVGVTFGVLIVALVLIFIGMGGA